MKDRPAAQPHLAISELKLAPGAEWTPRFRGWSFMQIRGGIGYWRQSGAVRELPTGSSLVFTGEARGTLRASQLGEVVIAFFRVEPDKLTGLLSLGEQHLLRKAASQEQLSVRVLSAADIISERFKNLCLNRNGAPLSLYMRLQLAQLFFELFKQELDQEQTTEEDPDGRTRLQQLLKQLPASEFMELSLSDLAPKMHCSPRHLSRLFREEMGVSFREKQTELRLTRACELLATSNAKVIDVASTSGYQSNSLFSLLFKKRFGVSPGQWRLRHGWRAPARARFVVAQSL